MSDIAVQASFNSGEWAPSLYARVDQAKYRSGAALLENFYVDYRGGATSRPGSKYVIQARDSSNPVRVITFQASAEIGFALEVGHQYIRFISNGQPVVEPTFAISGASQANPCVLTIVGNNYTIGDWIFVTGVLGMTQLNNRYFIVTNVAGSLVTISDLRGTPVNSTLYTAYTSTGTAARIYTIASPYIGADLAMLKFAQSGGGELIICHKSYPTYRLNELSANNWTLTQATFGTTANKPTGVTASITSSGQTTYGYVVTSVDINGQESIASDPVKVTGGDMQTDNHSSVNIAWAPAVNADHYRIYRAIPTNTGIIPDGSMYGYEGYTHGTAFNDRNIAPDYTKTPPIAKNPFVGNGILSVTVTAPGTYTTVPTVSFTGGVPSIPASANAVLSVLGTPTVGAGGAGYAIGDTVSFDNSVTLMVATVTAGAVTAWRPVTFGQSNPGQITSGATPTNPVAQVSSSGGGTGATANLTWGVGVVNVTNQGAGYTFAVTTVFTPAGATGTANLNPTNNGNPSVPSFCQQRLVLAAPIGAPQTFYMSQTGRYFNYNISLPVQGDDSITGTLASGVINTIKSIVSTSAGMMLLTDRAVWLINGGSSGSAITPSATVANVQSYVGASDLPPILANFDVLFVQEKGSSIRDLAYNVYFNTFTGTDISIVSSHLFLGHKITEWAWAEEPFKVVWAVRDDGVMLTLTFLKEQEFIGWSHQTTRGRFRSVTAVAEVTDDNAGVVDAVYTVVDRVVAGQTWKYIERFAERLISEDTDTHDWWAVDAGLQYNGAPTTLFSGGEHLAGLTVTGLADGIVIPPFVMPSDGTIRLTTPASIVTIGLDFVCDLKTLALDIGEPSIQGKVKKINNVDIRVQQTLGLYIGPDFDHLTPMKDLVRGNVSSMLTGQPSQIVTGLLTGDARTFIGSGYTVPGQYCIRQRFPLPAQILGVFPSVTIGDTDR